MGDIYNPDIQNAPVFPVSFQVLDDQEKHIYAVTPENGKAVFYVYCAIYVPESFYESNHNKDVFVYFSALVDNQVADQVVAKFPFDTKSDLYRFQVEFDLPFSDADNVNIQIACTTKHDGEMGISESLRVGRFLNTRIPIEKHGGPNE